MLTGTKMPGPASRTGATPLGKGGSQGSKGAGATSGKAHSQGKGGGVGSKANAQSQVSVVC